MKESYSEFFGRVTKRVILPYQERYGRNPFSPALLIVPTGLGKTDAILLPWLYGRAAGVAETPTRLVVVLPRQNLTSQTAQRARELVNAAGLADTVRVLELMGGSEDNRERLGVKEPAIIVATQDLYFSRALNRGYARRPPRWPIDFALYNQDCLIVLDEVQLMDEALATSTQLAAFRERFGTFGDAPCVWMSATANPAWLKTVDFGNPPPEIRLEKDDLATPVVVDRYYAAKALAPAPLECDSPAGCAAFALAQHRTGTRTLILCNTVPRAREIFAAVRKELPGAILMHSRFRPFDRKSTVNELDLSPAEGQIFVATQVLEAGIDITARLLITDIAPWSSLVQRFGRVNRYGGDAEAEIFWVAKPTYAKQNDPAAPYSEEELEIARERLKGLTSAAPADLALEDGPATYQYVLRQADLLDLFDTTPDLSGNELDVSRFIRATEDKHVYLAWRNWEGDGPPPDDLPEPEDEELCPIPIGEFRAFAAKHRVYTLSFATEQWARVQGDTVPYPGMVAVTRTNEGGYTASDGWSPESKLPVAEVRVEALRPADTDSRDLLSFPQEHKYRQTLRAHVDRVREKMEALLAAVKVGKECEAALRCAALKHDWGKAHEVFQATLKREADGELLAKQCGMGKHCRPHFRHELASALAMLATGESDLAAYVVAAHHGRIRLGVRSMPEEREKDGKAIARGIVDGETLPNCVLATGVEVPAVRLGLEAMQLGAEGGSWTERMLRLRDEFGPFRLAYLEMLLRSADEAASADPGREVTECPA